MARRRFLGTAIAVPTLCGLSEAAAQPYDGNGLDRRTLENVERAWMKTRFVMDQWMETGRLKPRDVWPAAKQNIVRGSFNLGYREAGKAEVIENGVRTGRIACTDPTCSSP